MSRKPLVALATSVTVLVAAGIAFAHGGGPGTIQPVSATFDAMTVANAKSGTCTGADGTYTRTKATYTGTAVSTDSRLNGTLTVRARTLYNSTTNLGLVDGRFRVENADGRTEGSFVGVDDNGTLSGYVSGHGRRGWAKLMGPVSATFDPTTGFQAGQLGSGASAGTAVFALGRCDNGSEDDNGDGSHGDKPGKSKKHKHGKHGHKK
jgi:hypothetical protein